MYLESDTSGFKPVLPLTSNRPWARDVACPSLIFAPEDEDYNSSYFLGELLPRKPSKGLAYVKFNQNVPHTCILTDGHLILHLMVGLEPLLMSMSTAQAWAAISPHHIL